MRISLTALTPQGPRDVVIYGDSEMTVDSATQALERAMTSGTPGGSTGRVPSPPPPGDGPEGQGGGQGGGQGHLTATGLGTVARPPAPHRVQHRALWNDGRMLDPQAPAARELRDGAIVTTDPSLAPATVTAEPSGPVEIRVVGGPAAGTVHRLGLGMTTLGRGPDADLRIDDPAVPALALRITVRRETVDVEVCSGNGRESLDGSPLTGHSVWPPGAMLTVGSTVLTLATGTAPDVRLTPLPTGGSAFARPPRATPAAPPGPRRLELPRPPERDPRERPRRLAALLLSAVGLVLLLALRQWWWALPALAWPALWTGERLAERLGGRTPYVKALKEHHARAAEFGATVERLRREDEEARRALHPDPAELLLTATGPRHRLWERRISDADTLLLRAGLTDLPSGLELAGVPEPPIARLVPVPLPLTELGIVGVAGPRPASRALARWLVAQAAVLHSPRDLAIVVFSTEAGAAEHWNWVRWLPHAAPRDAEECVALVGADAESVARRVTELAIRITERRREGSVPYNILLVLDGARSLRRVPGMPQVLARGPEYGVYALCLDDTVDQLPEECSAVVAWDPAERPDTIRLSGSGSASAALVAAGPVLADQVSAAWCERLARALGPIRDVSGEDSAAGPPTSVRLLDLLGMPDPTAAQVIERWQEASDPQGARDPLRVPIGRSAEGVFELDLRGGGPHVVIGGTSGTGKSELLQTLISALAVADRPDRMSFILIDHRVGSAFNECSALPHTVGTFTEFDERSATRALISLDAELRRREAERSLPRPRLVLAVDDFEALAAALPGFAAGLLDLGERGRELGVHLLLATRRAGGIIGSALRAGSVLHDAVRVGLRVAHAEESVDLLGSPVAARIPGKVPGRCYVTGTAVQAARIGGRRTGGHEHTGQATALALDWAGLGRPPRIPAPEGTPGPAEGATDLAVLVAALGAAAQRAGIPRQPSPWLRPLPHQLLLDPRPAGGGSVIDLPPIEFGVTDLPAEQAREPLAFDLRTGGHLLIAGAAGTGRTTALRSLAGSLASSCSPYDVHLHAVDCGAGSLLPLTALPHCGAVVMWDRPDRVERLLTALAAEVERRRRLLAEAGFGSLAEQRASVASSERLPWMVLLIDRWEGFLGAFQSRDQGRLVEAVPQLLREGEAVGLRAVFTGDEAVPAGPLAPVFQTRLTLRADFPPGRVLEPVPGADLPRESQIGLLAADPSERAQEAALKEIARECTRRYHRVPHRMLPLRVDELPARLAYDEALDLDPHFLAPSPLWSLAGAGGDALAPVGADLAACAPGFVVAGPPGSGRSTALLTMVRSLLDPAVGGGLVPVAVIAPRRSPLRELGVLPGVLGVLDGTADQTDLEALLADEHRYVVVADDAELLDGTELDDALCAVLRSARDGEHAAVVGCTTDDLTRATEGFLAEARRSRSGVLLGVTSPADGEPFGLRLPRGCAADLAPPGRGLFVAAGVPTLIQVALPVDR